MIKLFCKALENNHDRLRNYISSNEQGECDSYESIIRSFTTISLVYRKGGQRG